MKKGIILVLLVFSLMAQKLERGLGCLPEDPRDKPWIIPSSAPTFYWGKASVDHTPYMPPVGNQGAQGSCVAWATAYYYKTYMERMEHGSSWDVTNTQFQMSPAFVYNLINGGTDNGAYISDGFKCISDIGVCPVLDKTYNDADYSSWPSEIAFGKASAYRGGTTYSINITTDAGINQLKNILSQGYNAVISISVWTQFWYGNFGADTVYDTGDKIGSIEGGHAVCIIGFNDDKVTTDGNGAVKIINSWGTDWGPGGGYFYMSYAALKDAQLCGGYAYYQTDKLFYNPTLKVRYKVTHNRRERIRITLQVPKASFSKDFFNWTIGASAFYVYPTYYVTLDLTDALDYIDPYKLGGTDDTIKVIVRDITTDGQIGTFDFAYIENRDWGTYGQSYDLSKTIPDNGRCTTYIVFAENRTQWPSFHSFLNNDGISGLGSTLRNFTNSSTVNHVSPLNPPVIADINKDGKMDIVVTTQNGYCYAYTDTLLTPLWSFGPVYTNINSHPFISDVEPNDTLDIVFNAGDSTYILKGIDGSPVRKLRPLGVNWTSSVVTNLDGDYYFEIITIGESKSIRVYNGSTGASKWYFPTSSVYPIRTNPAIGDVDCNGIPDIAITSVNGTAYLVRRTSNSTIGTLVWSYATGDSIYSSPVISNIDSTGSNGGYEVIFGSDDGYIYVINLDGTLKWRYNIGSKIRSTPTVGDVNNDGKKEVFVGADDGSLYFFDYLGNFLRRFESGGAIRSSPVLLDIDGDNIKDIIFGSDDCSIYAVKFADASLIWRFNADGAPTTPAIGDIDDDGNADIVFGTGNGTLYVLRANPTGVQDEDADELKVLTNTIQRNKLNLHYFLPNSGETDIKLCDITGRVLDNINEYQEKGWQSKEFTLSLNGVYFVILKNSKSVTTKKVIFIR